MTLFHVKLNFVVAIFTLVFAEMNLKRYISKMLFDDETYDIIPVFKRNISHGVNHNNDYSNDNTKLRKHFCNIVLTTIPFSVKIVMITFSN